MDDQGLSAENQENLLLVWSRHEVHVKNETRNTVGGSTMETFS